MNKILYRICKVINWIIPFLIILLGEKLYTGYSLFVLIGYLAFAVFWFWWSTTRSRLTYQIFFFTGHIIGLYNVLTRNDTIFESMGNYSSVDVALGTKVIIVFISVIAFASKIITMIAETSEYYANSKNRHNNRLDEEVYVAIGEVERARTLREKQIAEAHLEEAKLNKERYKL